LRESDRAMTLDNELRLSNLRTKAAMGLKMSHGELQEMVDLENERRRDWENEELAVTPTPPKDMTLPYAGQR